MNLNFLVFLTLGLLGSSKVFSSLANKNVINNCGSNNDTLVFNSFIVQPDPIKIPGK